MPSALQYLIFAPSEQTNNVINHVSEWKCHVAQSNQRIVTHKVKHAAHLTHRTTTTITRFHSKQPNCDFKQTKSQLKTMRNPVILLFNRVFLAILRLVWSIRYFPFLWGSNAVQLVEFNQFTEWRIHSLVAFDYVRAFHKTESRETSHENQK